MIDNNIHVLVIPPTVVQAHNIPMVTPALRIIKVHYVLMAIQLLEPITFSSEVGSNKFFIPAFQNIHVTTICTCGS